MRNRILRRLREDRGQAFTEFVLILPIALVLIFGVIDLGKAISYWLDSGHLANLGARYAVVNSCPQQPACNQSDPAYPVTLLQSIRNDATTPQLRTNATVCLRDLSSNAWAATDEIRLTVTSPYSFIPFLHVASTTRHLTGRSDMRLEQTWVALPASNPYGVGPDAASCDQYTS